MCPGTNFRVLTDAILAPSACQTNKPTVSHADTTVDREHDGRNTPVLGYVLSF
jgi:hypothetical protein